MNVNLNEVAKLSGIKVQKHEPTLNEGKKIMTAPADGLSAHDWVDVLGIPGFADMYPERSLLTPTSFVMKIAGKDKWPVLCVWKGNVTKEEIESAVDAYIKEQ